MCSTKDKPCIQAGDYPTQDVPFDPAQDVPPPTLTLQAYVWRLERRCQELTARNGNMIDRLRAMCNDPATSEETKQAIGDVINS